MRGSLVEVQVAVERAAEWGITGIMGTPEELASVGHHLPDSLGVMALGGGRAGGQRNLRAPFIEADYEAFEPGVRPQGQDAEVQTFTLDLRRQGRSASLIAIESALGGASPTPAAVLLGQQNEDALEALAGIDDVAIFVPGDAFASGYRHGAGSHFGVLTALHPWSAARASELVSEDVVQALAIERRLQRFLEVELEPLTRRLRLGENERDGLLLEIMGWMAVPEPQIGADVAHHLAERLRRGFPVLFENAP